ncbi:MAG: transporter, partial [Mucilaginibacter sp.]|nr:transporter [Mucilaginibacter sp.]
MTEEGDSKPQKVDSFAALRYKDFRSYIGMRFCFTFAYTMQAFVLGLYIWHITHSKFQLGCIGLCEAIPAVCIALYGGYIADKSEKRKMLMLIFGGVIITAVVMFMVTLKSMQGVIHANWIAPIIFVMIFFNGVARAFYGPATFTIYAHSIPKELYPNGSTWSSSSWQVAAILGPAAAGFVYAYSDKIKFLNGLEGITATFGIIIFLLLVSFILVITLRKYPPVFVPKENIFESLLEGIRFVISNKMMIGAMSLDLFSVFFGGAVAL